MMNLFILVYGNSNKLAVVVLSICKYLDQQWLILFCGSLALALLSSPTSRSNGTRRPLAVLEFGFFQGSAASFKLSERRAPYLYVGQSNFNLHALMGVSVKHRTINYGKQKISNICKLNLQ